MSDWSHVLYSYEPGDIARLYVNGMPVWWMVLAHGLIHSDYRTDKLFEYMPNGINWEAT